MKVSAFLIFLCCGLFLTACTKSSAENESVKNKTINENRTAAEDNASPTPAKSEVSNNKKTGKCQPENIPLTPGLPEKSDMNSLAAKPKTREEFNEWLGNSNNVRVAELANRKDIREYYGEGDFNGDGCRDVAIIVGGTEDKTGEISLENQEVSVTLQNLRTNAVFAGGDVKKLPFSKDFAAQIKPQQTIAIFIVLGGESGWSWKFGGAGRTFLLYDSIIRADAKNAEENSTVFEVLEKNKPDEDEDDLIALFPQSAKGDCVHTETQTKAKTEEFTEGKNRLLICFENEKFAAKKLSDTKYFPE